MPDTLHDKVVLIVGGTEAGGASLAVSLAKRGADVALVYFDDEHKRARQIQSKVESNGRRCLTVAAEPDSEWFTGRVIGRVVEDLGHLDIFIDYAALPQNDLDADSEVLQLGKLANPFSNFEMMAAVLKQMTGGANDSPDRQQRPSDAQR